MEDEAGWQFGDEVGALLGHEASGVGGVDYILEGWRREDEGGAGVAGLHCFEELVEVVGVGDGLASGEDVGVDAEERFEHDVLQDGGGEVAPGVGDVVGHGALGGGGGLQQPGSASP